MVSRLKVFSMRNVTRLTFALCVLGQAVCGLPAMAAEKVVMGWLPATDALPFFVALEEKAPGAFKLVDQKWAEYWKNWKK